MNQPVNIRNQCKAKDFQQKQVIIKSVDDDVDTILKQAGVQ